MVENLQISYLLEKTRLLSHSSRPCHVYLAIMMSLAKIGLFRMVEPLHLHYHAAAPGLPEALNATDEGEVGSAS